MQRRDYQREELSAISRKRTSAAVTYVIVNLWLVLVCLYFQKPVLMVYLMFLMTACLFGRLRHLQQERDRMLLTQYDSSVYGNREEVVFDLDRYIQESTRELREQSMEDSPSRANLAQRDHVDRLQTEEDFDFQIDNVSRPRLHGRPRGPHPDLPVRPPAHAGQLWEEPEFIEPEIPAEWLSDPEDSRDELETLRRNIRDINVVSFNRVSQPIPLCPSL